MPSKFLTDLVYRDNFGQTWTLVEPLVYQSETKGQFVVPVGFGTDMASIPGAVQGLIHKTGPWDRPAVLHDYIYTNNFFDRLICDRLLLEAMTAEGVGRIKRYTIYYAVRLGGWVAWNQHKARLARQ